MPRYAELIYNGFWFSPEREMLQAAIDHSQKHVTGTVRLKLYKGRRARSAAGPTTSLYSEAHVTFEEDAGAYDQKDAAGFIKLNALRLQADRHARAAAALAPPAPARPRTAIAFSTALPCSGSRPAASVLSRRPLTCA